MSRWAAWLTVALISSSCHRQAIPEPLDPRLSTETAVEPSSSIPPKPADPATSGPARSATPRERAAVDALIRAAEAVRQLRLREPVKIEIEDGDAIANSLHSQIEEAELERARLL